MFDSLKKLFVHAPNNTIKPTVLIVFDGWGIAPPSPGNAISQAKKPNMDMILANYPHSELIASGESVGLPANVVGNSEVGHLTIGVGRVIDESLTRINRSIEQGEFFFNEGIIKAMNFALANKSTLHLAGMASSGNVHSSLSHLYALIEFSIRMKIPRVRLHLFTDGRDASPNDGATVLDEIQKRISSTPSIKIASVTGRYYSMDRDARWERIEATYNAMVLGRGNLAKSAKEAVESYYKQGLTDEFVPATVIVENNAPVGCVSDNDALVFFNFRVDRSRELPMSFVVPDFETIRGIEWGFDLDQGNVKSRVSAGPTFKREKVLKNLFSVSMTEYQKQLPVSAIAFPTFEVSNSMAEVISKMNLAQMHLAESEKERMVTYYFDGLRTVRFKNEEVKIVSSPRVPTYDKRPQMSVEALTREFVHTLRKDKYHFIVLNIANPDMVAHSGKLPATIRAIEYVDKAVGKMVEETLLRHGTLFITADHGNAEELLTYSRGGFFFTSNEGSMNTEHSNNPVPFIAISESLKGKTNVLRKGALSDVAPTILSLMGLTVPEEMTGVNLLELKN